MLIAQHIRVTVDAVVFGYTPKQGMSVLLIKRKIPPHIFKWALPGGFVHNDESFEDGIKRELQEEAGVSINYLEQLYSFGDVQRDPRGRVVSIAYWGLVNPSNFKLAANTDAEDAMWCRIDELPFLAFDHDKIIQMALVRLRNKIRYEPVGFELLDKKFSIAELERLYETLLGRPVDRRNFQKKIHSFNILIPQNEKLKHPQQGRPAQLFSFDEKRYDELKKEGIYFEL
ncbi:8-oxo-dGTP diphosphatase [Chitinophaga skermanii]|uniref:8-oxo-dGTP diphosphatase n=1 Tax=Chitinophaga skermanii TaxID=331697 RepID=A0A327QC37_9BACT|nr:NUDIX domain-containing protein [Chitinophaga skermanii]RAJ01535.1 8-oxo-dGTP diphosphatase [Chitinophaga skermanii]